MSILHAIADGNRFGFDIMDATGLTSGTVYPALDKLESLGYLTSRWEDARIARRDKRPPRRYFDLTNAGATALAGALNRYKNLRPVSLAAWRLGKLEAVKSKLKSKVRKSLLRLLLAIVDAGQWLAPPSRRRDWRRQWRADILHEWQWLTRHPKGVGDRAALLVRAAGALRHALWLRLHVRRLEMLTQDIRYGWRLMIRRPAFTLVAVLTLGLGIGANITIYSWVQALLLRPMPTVPAADRLVSLSTTTRTRNDLSVSWPNFVDMRTQRPTSVEDLLAYAIVPLNLRTGTDPERVWGLLVSGNYFDVLGLRPALGRGFDAADRVPEANPVAVFSYAYWQRHFAADPTIVGRSVTLERPRLHRRRHRTRGISRHRSRARHRRVRPDDDAEGGDARRSPAGARQQLAADDGAAEAWGVDRTRPGRLRCRRAQPRGSLSRRVQSGHPTQPALARSGRERAAAPGP